MAKRIIEKRENIETNLKAITRYDSDWCEYTVSIYHHGEHLKESDYFTDCKIDAIETAKEMIK